MYIKEEEKKPAIKSGPHWFSGIDEFHIDGDDDFGWNSLDGYAIVVDGKTYLAVEDSNDGYRSFAFLRPLVKGETVKVINQFEPQLVYAESFWNMDEDEFVNESVFLLKNQYGQIFLQISTDYWDDYYPVGVVRYYPENLPCNAKPLPN